MANYFDLPEVIIPLIKFSDRKTLKEFYLTHHELMNQPLIIMELQNYYQIPGKLDTFADFIFEYDIRHKEWRDQLCLGKSSKIMQHAVKSGDVKLVKELLSDGFNIDRAAFLAGTLGQTEMIDLVPLKGNYLIMNGRNLIADKVLDGLAFASRNDLLQKYDKEYDQTISRSRYLNAIRGGNNFLVKKWYNPDRREETLRFAASANNLELINWLSNALPFDKDDNLEIIMGALYGGNVSLLATYSDDEIMKLLADTDNKKVIGDAAHGNNPQILENFITLLSHGDPIKKDFLVDTAFEEASSYGSRQILKYLLLTQYEGLAIREVYKFILSQDSFSSLRRYVSENVNKYLPFNEIIALAKSEGLTLMSLLKDISVHGQQF